MENIKSTGKKKRIIALLKDLSDKLPNDPAIVQLKKELDEEDHIAENLKELRIYTPEDDHKDRSILGDSSGNYHSMSSNRLCGKLACNQRHGQRVLWLGRGDEVRENPQSSFLPPLHRRRGVAVQHWVSR